MDPTGSDPAAVERARLAALASYGVLDTPAESDFDVLTTLAAELCDAPYALVSLVDADRQWNKSVLGGAAVEAPRELSFCAHALGTEGVMVVPDATADSRFAHNDQVTGPAAIRFYAGAPLRTPEGQTLGTLCVLDTVPRLLTPAQSAHLTALARQVMAQLVLRKQARDLQREIATRERAEVALAESHGLMQGVLAASTSLVFVKDLDGRFLLANPAVHEALGRPAGSLLGLTDLDLFPAAVAGVYRRHDREIAQHGEPRDYAEQIEHPSGTVRHFQSRKYPLTDAAGTTYAVAGVSTDVTELISVRHEVAEAARRWRGMVERSQTGVVMVSDRGVLLYANPVAEQLHLGTAPGPLAGRRVHEFIEHDTDLAENRDLFLGVLSGEAVRDRPGRLRRADGTVVNIDLNATLSQYDGEPCLQVEMWDTTARETASTALRESETRWHTLFAGSPVGIGLCDENDRYIAVNDALCTLYGREASEVIGRTGNDFTHSDDRHLAAGVRQRIGSADDGIAHLEKRYVRPDGSVRWAWVSLTHTPGPLGQDWMLAHVQDITQRRATEQAVARSEANLTAVARVVQQIQTGGDARQTIVEASRELADAASVSLFEVDATTHLVINATTDPSLLGIRIGLSETSAAVEVYRTGQALLLPDPSAAPQVLPSMLRRTKARSVYFIPVRFAGQVTAVLLVVWTRPVTSLDDHRPSVVSLLADHAGVALRQAALLGELETLALTDPLTGLPNRRSWNDRLARLLVAAGRRGQQLTLALADLDHFKIYNDRHGHPAGDALLRRFAQAADDAVRAGDLVARWGGEEFAVALPDCSTEEATRVLDRVRRAVPHDETCSIGYASWDGVETAAQLTQRADEALYAAKHAGRNQILAAR